MRITTMNWVVILFIAVLNLWENRATPEVTYPNIYVFGGTNTIQFLYQSAEGTRNGSILSIKSDNKFIHNLQQDLQLPNNITMTIFQDNPSDSNKNSQEQIRKTPNLVSSVTNKDLMGPTNKTIDNAREEEINESDADTGECETPFSSVGVPFAKSIKPIVWPWMSAIYIFTSNSSLQYICGGTLIAPNLVLTAANCFYPNSSIDLFPQIQNFMIGLGYISQNHEDDGIVTDIKKIIIHPDYSGRASFRNDIAIVMLPKSYGFSYSLPLRVDIACLWTDMKTERDSVGYIAAFDNDEDNAEVLILHKVGIVSQDTCSRRGRESTSAAGLSFSDTNLCADYVKGQVSYPGNIGHGLIIENKGKYYLRGIVIGVLDTGYILSSLTEYGVYTDVSKFTEWIKENMINNKF